MVTARPFCRQPAGSGRRSTRPRAGAEVAWRAKVELQACLSASAPIHSMRRPVQTRASPIMHQVEDIDSSQTQQQKARDDHCVERVNPLPAIIVRYTRTYLTHTQKLQTTQQAERYPPPPLRSPPPPPTPTHALNHSDLHLVNLFWCVKLRLVFRKGGLRCSRALRLWRPISVAFTKA